MNLPTEGQVNAGLRHVYTAAGTGFTILATFAIIPQDKVQPLLNALHQIGDGLNSIMGGLSALWIILGPIAVGLAAKAAMFSASFRNQLKSVTAAASAPSADGTEKKVELAQATANVPGIVQVSAAPEIANATPDPKVVPAIQASVSTLQTTATATETRP